MTDVNILRGESVKVGDTHPPLRVQCLDSHGEPFNLSDYTVDSGGQVNIKIRRSDGDTLKIDAAATVEQEDRGIVEYDWSSGDTDTSGVFDAELVADDGSGNTVTFPNDRFFTIIIQEGL